MVFLRNEEQKLMPMARSVSLLAREGAHLRVRIEGINRIRFYHPTWEMQYLTELNSTETK